MNMEGKPQGKSSNKRSLEGNINTSSNSFSILSNDDLVDKSIAMGVNINCGDYSSIDMLRNLEDARNALYNKKIQQEECVISSEPPLEVSDLITQEDDEDENNSESFTLVTSKRNRKAILRLSLSGRKPSKNKNKENPCGKRIHQSLSNKKNDERSFLEL